MEVTLGGDRLGAGGKQKIHMKEYERSTHDLSYVFRSTMASGTLVPFLNKVALPGDTFDIDLEAEVLTHPTIGPLFGSYKVQLDVFQIPIRLYQGLLHMNMNNIGMDMKNVKLPVMRIYGRKIEAPEAGEEINLDNYQMNPSCLLAYLGIRGIGYSTNPAIANPSRLFNAIPLLGYWEIYKNYYANKQEEIGMMIHHPKQVVDAVITDIKYYQSLSTEEGVEIEPYDGGTPKSILGSGIPTSRIEINILETNYEEFDPSRIRMNTLNYGSFPLTDVYSEFTWSPTISRLVASQPIHGAIQAQTNWIQCTYTFDTSAIQGEIVEPKLEEFNLSNIDDMRVNILRSTGDPSAVTLTRAIAAPYGNILDFDQNPDGTLDYIAVLGNQEGLGIKTYQSDQFNNWISTEWIDGDNGINALTAIDTSGGSFTIDELNMSNKVYNMLNRIALSGGTYNDWLDTVYTHKRVTQPESPIYMGGLSKELVFQEVISNSASEEQPLGTLAGRGKLSGKHKGGKIRVRVDEPSYIMGIVSITPRIDYSQGNEWDVNLKTMDDFHKPALDEIGFQDLVTDQMAWWSTWIDGTTVTYNSAGKQPAWLNYMTSVNKVYGNFAEEAQQMFMILNRRYEVGRVEDGVDNATTIKDLTTYIDPVKFNYIFADTRRDAQNFWMQIGVDITARRKMSAKVIPNL